MDEYRPNSSIDKKKMLVPLVTLLLCFTALMGCAYAYNAAVTSESTITNHSYEVTIDQAVSGSVTFTDTVDLRFNTTTDKNGVKYELDPSSDNVLAFKVYMVNAKNTDGFTISSVTVAGLDGKNLKCTQSISEWDTDHYNVTLTFTLLDSSKPTDSEVNITVTINTENKP